MTAISFPNNPSSGDTHTAGNGIVYTYDGEKWTSIGTNSAGTWTRSGTEVSLTNAGDDLNVDSGTLFVDASTDRVGIGTQSPGSFNSSANQLVVGTGSAPQGLTISTGTTNNGTIYFADGTTGTDDRSGAIIYDHGGDNFRFHTAANERMRIDSSGRVGIGTSSPSSFLHVDSNNTYGSVVLSRDGGASGRRPFGIGISGSTDANLRISASSDTTGANAFANQLVDITADGKVGIGVTGPQHLCQIAGTLAVDSYNDTTKTITLRPGYEANANGGMGLVAKDHSGAAPDGLGIYGTDGVSVHTANAGTFFERFRVDTSGRLLVGTTTEGYAGAETFTIANALNAGITIRTGTGSNGSLAFSDGTSGLDEYRGLVQYRHADNSLNFFTDGSERMRIVSNGAQYAYSSSDGITASVSSAAASVGAIFEGRHSATAVATGTGCFVVRYNGNVQNTNNTYTAISDIKLKENIVDSASQWNDIKGIRVRKYNFKESTNHETFTQLGVIAQEVETVSPGLVIDNPDTDNEGNDLGTVTKSVNYSVLYMKAVKALQEAMERIETLEAKVAALEAQ